MYNPVLIAGGRRRRRAAVGLEINDPRRTPPGSGGGVPLIPNWGPGGSGLTPTGGGMGNPGYGVPGGGTGNPGYGVPGGGTGNPGGWTPGPAIPGPTIPQPATPVREIPGCAIPCNVCPEDLKRYYLPFVPDSGYTASVTAGSLVRFIGRPQKLFKPDRLIIGSTIAPYFDIVSLSIGNIPQSLAAGNVGADMFSEVATYVMMTFDQAYPGIDIILTAQNKSSVTQTFQAQLIGEAVG